MPVKKDETNVVDAKEEAVKEIKEEEKKTATKKATTKKVIKDDKEEKSEAKEKEKVEKKAIVKKEKVEIEVKEKKAPKKVKTVAKGKTDEKHGQYFDDVEVNCICGAALYRKCEKGEREDSVISSQQAALFSVAILIILE